MKSLHQQTDKARAKENLVTHRFNKCMAQITGTRRLKRKRAIGRAVTTIESALRTRS